MHRGMHVLAAVMHDDNDGPSFAAPPPATVCLEGTPRRIELQAANLAAIEFWIQTQLTSEYENATW